MSSIFNIQQDLFDIFDQIEANEGELTPELEESLSIKKEEFTSKIESYANMIRQLENDLVNIKVEKERLDNLKKSKENTIAKLKEIMYNAVNIFGNTSKSGSKFIDYGTGKVTTKVSNSIIVDDIVLDSFTKRFKHYLDWLNYSNTPDNCTPEELINGCNTKSENSEDDIEINTNITIGELKNVAAKITINANMMELIQDENFRHSIINMYKLGLVEIESKVSKKDVTDDLKATGEIPCFTNVLTKYSVVIK